MWQFEQLSYHAKGGCKLEGAEPAVVIYCEDGFLGLYELEEVADIKSSSHVPVEKYLYLGAPGIKEIKAHHGDSITYSVDTGHLAVTEFVGPNLNFYMTNVFHLMGESNTPESEKPMIISGYHTPSMIAI